MRLAFSLDQTAETAQLSRGPIGSHNARFGRPRQRTRTTTRVLDLADQPIASMSNPLEERGSSLAALVQVVLHRRVGDRAAEERFDGTLNFLDAKVTAGLPEDLDDSVTYAAELARRRQDRFYSGPRRDRPVSAAQVARAGR